VRNLWILEDREEREVVGIESRGREEEGTDTDCADFTDAEAEADGACKGG
jgi:hypothetical protein